jgi:hypothetical protein
MQRNVTTHFFRSFRHKTSTPELDASFFSLREVTHFQMPPFFALFT